MKIVSWIFLVFIPLLSFAQVPSSLERGEIYEDYAWVEEIPGNHVSYELLSFGRGFQLTIRPEEISRYQQELGKLTKIKFKINDLIKQDQHVCCGDSNGMGHQIEILSASAADNSGYLNIEGRVVSFTEVPNQENKWDTTYQLQIENSQTKTVQTLVVKYEARFERGNLEKMENLLGKVVQAGDIVRMIVADHDSSPEISKIIRIYLLQASPERAFVYQGLRESIKNYLSLIKSKLEQGEWNIIRSMAFRILEVDYTKSERENLVELIESMPINERPYLFNSKEAKELEQAFNVEVKTLPLPKLVDLAKRYAALECQTNEVVFADSIFRFLKQWGLSQDERLYVYRLAIKARLDKLKSISQDELANENYTGQTDWWSVHQRSVQGNVHLSLGNVVKVILQTDPNTDTLRLSLDLAKELWQLDNHGWTFIEDGILVEVMAGIFQSIMYRGNGPEIKPLIAEAKKDLDFIGELVSQAQKADELAENEFFEHPNEETERRYLQVSRRYGPLSSRGQKIYEFLKSR